MWRYPGTEYSSFRLEKGTEFAKSRPSLKNRKLRNMNASYRRSGSRNDRQGSNVYRRQMSKETGSFKGSFKRTIRGIIIYRSNPSFSLNIILNHFQLLLRRTLLMMNQILIYSLHQLIFWTNCLDTKIRHLHWVSKLIN